MDGNTFKAHIIITNHFKQLPVKPKVVYANKNFLDLVGFTLEQISDSNPEAIFSNWNNNEFISEIVNCVEQKTPWQGVLNILNKDNFTVPKLFTINPVYNIEGEIAYYSCSTQLDPSEVRDKTRTKESCLDSFVATLWAFTENFKQLCELAPASLLKIDHTGKITFTNIKSQEKFGLKVNDNLFDMISYSDIPVKSYFNDKQIIGKVSKIAFDLTVNDLTWGIQCRFWPLVDNGGTIIGHSVYLRDETVRRRVYKELLALKGL